MLTTTVVDIGHGLPTLDDYDCVKIEGPWVSAMVAALSKFRRHW